MTSIFIVSLSCGLLCGLWVWLAGFTALSSILIAWVGFGGCTAYFASGESGKNGVKTAMPAVLSGLCWATLAIWLPEKIQIIGMGVFMSALISFLMCYQSKAKLFKFIPGAFIGSFSTFAAIEAGQDIIGQGFVKMALSLIIGVILGLSIDTLAQVIQKSVVIKKEGSENIAK